MILLPIATTGPKQFWVIPQFVSTPKIADLLHLKGKKAIVPIVNRAIPIIEDEYVDIEFGTGSLKSHTCT